MSVGETKGKQVEQLVKDKKPKVSVWAVYQCFFFVFPLVRKRRSRKSLTWFSCRDEVHERWCEASTTQRES